MVKKEKSKRKNIVYDAIKELKKYCGDKFEWQISSYIGPFGGESKVRWYQVSVDVNYKLLGLKVEGAGGGETLYANGTDINKLTQSVIRLCKLAIEEKSLKYNGGF